MFATDAWGCFTFGVGFTVQANPGKSVCVFLLLIGFMPMCTKHVDMIRLHLALEKRSCHALDLDFTCNLVVALEDLTEIFATAFIASSLESTGTASSSLSWIWIKPKLQQNYMMLMEARCFTCPDWNSGITSRKTVPSFVYKIVNNGKG